MRVRARRRPRRALLGGPCADERARDLIFKPRNRWHTFRNAGAEPAPLVREHLNADLNGTLLS